MSRKANAICEAINRRERRFAAWAKHDPTRTDLPVPQNIVSLFSEYEAPFKRYENHVHAIYRPSGDREATRYVLKAFLDLYFEEGGFVPLKKYESDYEEIRSEYFECLMPAIGEQEVAELFAGRRFVVLEGPPGTGKTRMAVKLIASVYEGRGTSIQFHPNTTYESFIGGLAPSEMDGDVGFRFRPAMGALMKAAAAAEKLKPKPYLLHIDEINRADLAKVLGEAIHLLEFNEEVPRTISLPYDFGAPNGNRLALPKNLHIPGTMNSADRSIAILDLRS